MNQLISTVVGTVVGTSTSVAIESVAKLATPAGVKAVTGFLIKGLTLVVGGVISSKVASIAVENTEAVLETVRKSSTDVVLAVEGDN